MKTLREIAILLGVLLSLALLGAGFGALLTCGPPTPIERVSVQICEHGACYMQDVPAAQFVGKKYTTSVLTCAAFSMATLQDGLTPDSITVGDRCYLMTPSEVTR